MKYNSLQHVLLIIMVQIIIINARSSYKKKIPNADKTIGGVSINNSSSSSSKLHSL